MRYSANPTALLVSAAMLSACGGTDENAATDSSAGTTPPAEVYVLAGTDGSWTGEIASGGIVFRRVQGAMPDSIVFDYANPSTDGVMRKFTSVRMAADTHRIDIALSTVPCTDATGTEHTHSVQIWVDQVPYGGCATRK